jgi:hypothetical protein
MKTDKSRIVNYYICKILLIAIWLLAYCYLICHFSTYYTEPL